MDSTLQNKASGSQYTVPNKFQLLAPSVSRHETDGICIWNQVTHSKSNDLYLKSATTRLYDTEAKIICIVSKKGAQCIECHHKDI